METDFTVKVDHINKQTGEHYSRIYPFSAYCNNASFDLKQVLYEVENLFFKLENYKNREEWSDESQEAFSKVRKKLLNNINNIARLPETLHYKGSPCNSAPSGEMIAQIINNANH